VFCSYFICMLQARDSMLKYLLYRTDRVENEVEVGLPFDRQQKKIL
jgi:hypothetical protein